jgi:HlyD family secretion protein
MSRRRPVLAVVVAFAVALALAAGFISRGFVSPAQQAARASAPRPSLITAPVRRGTLPVEVVLRATVAHPDPVAISAPASLAGDPVVTSVGVRVGEAVSEGSLLGTVAERPVFVMVGRVPAFRTITPGTSGVDVRELQQGLIAAGHDIGSDTAGTYGPGTAAAVLALYHARGVQPDVSSGAVGALTAARAQAAAAARMLASASGRRLPAAKSADAEARRALAQAQIAAEASVPLGEVVFVPRLPARVLSHASLGSTVGQGGATGAAATTGGSPSHAAPTLAVIGSSQVTLTASAGQSDASQLRSGMRGTAISDLSSTRLRVRLRAADAHELTFLPLRRVPTGLLGQSVEIDVVANRVRSLIVPISAISTDPTGRTYLTVVGARQLLRAVYVRLGYSTGGRQAVTAHGLRPGEPVLIGRQL